MGLFKKPYAPPETKGLDKDVLLVRARAASDPRDAHAYFAAAETLDPLDLTIQRELLLRGELHKRDAKNVSFFVIKSYILHAFEHPEKHTGEERKRMIREIFDHERLQNCLTLCEDKSAFLRDYLYDLSLDYVRIFIAPDTTHRPAVLGITLNGRLPAALAKPAGDMIINALACTLLSDAEQTLLAASFYRAYRDYMHGETQPLDALLGDDLVRLLPHLKG